MTAISRDGRAIVAAVDRVKTQIERLADALTTPVGGRADTADDATTTPTDGPRCVCGDRIELAGDPAVWRHSPGGTFGLDAHTPRPPDWLKTPARFLSIPEQRPAEHCEHNGPHPGFNCGEADQTLLFWEAQWARREMPDDEKQQPPEAVEEEHLRWTRRESLLVLLTRLQRGRTLTAAEADTLRHHVETEMREANEARARAEAAYRTLDTRTTEWNRAQAAVERVRALAVDTARAMKAETNDHDIGRYDTAVCVLDALREDAEPSALDGSTDTEQAVTQPVEEPEDRP